MRAHLIVGILLSGAIGSPSSVAEAVPVTFDFHGHVRSISGASGPITPFVDVGDPAHVTLRYDTATPPSFPSGGFYNGQDAITIRIKALIFEHRGDMRMLVQDNVTGGDTITDFVSMQGSSTAPASWPSQLGPITRGDLFVSWGAESIAGAPFPTFTTSNALPTSASFFRIPGGALARGFPTAESSYDLAITLAPTPEAATLLLVGTTAAGLGLARWVKRAKP